MVTPNLRKMTYNVHLEQNGYEPTLDGWRKWLTDYWKKTTEGQYDNHAKSVLPVFKEGLKRIDESKKNNDKAMQLVEEDDEKLPIRKKRVKMNNEKGFAVIEMLVVYVLLIAIIVLPISLWTQRSLEFWCMYIKHTPIHVSYWVSVAITVGLNGLALFANAVTEILRLVI